MSVFPMPPYPTGSAAQQCAQQYAYLFQMAQLLNVALGALEDGSAVTSAGGTSGSSGGTTEIKKQYDTLKSLVVKTADRVEKTKTQLTARLEEEYVAQSDFGTYLQELNARLEAQPEALTQYYRFASDLQANVGAVEAAFSRYRVNTEGYIRTGIVYYDGELPVYGVAVGQNLTCREVDGEQVVEPNNFRATFTATKLSFWQDNTEVAYVSNNKLYITNIMVLSGLSVGDWLITEKNGLAFRYIGGDT